MQVSSSPCCSPQLSGKQQRWQRCAPTWVALRETLCVITPSPQKFGNHGMAVLCPSLSGWQGPAMPAPWCLLSAVPVLVLLLHCQSSGPSFPSVHHLSLSKGRSCLQVTLRMKAEECAQELCGIDTAQGK